MGTVRDQMRLAAVILAMLACPAAGRITGFHVDDERCSGLLMNNRTQQEIVCGEYFDSLADLSATLRNFSSALKGPPLTLTVDAGTAWSCATGASGCFNLTYNGTTKSVGEHVVDLADDVVLMDYDRSAARIVERATPFLEYADTVRGAVSVGLAIAGPFGLAASWQTRNESELTAVMAASKAALSKHASFKGFSVFTESNWRMSTRGGATRPPLPDNTGTWYLDHHLVLNETQRAPWLIWAKSRKVGTVFIAPHAGTTALISIPGVEGSAADDAKFCDFIHEAEQVGVEVQLLSTPATDIAFIRNCSARGL